MKILCLDHYLQEGDCHGCEDGMRPIKDITIKCPNRGKKLFPKEEEEMEDPRPQAEILESAVEGCSYESLRGMKHPHHKIQNYLMLQLVMELRELNGHLAELGNPNGIFLANLGNIAHGVSNFKR